jgi:hypothetical protein
MLCTPTCTSHAFESHAALARSALSFQNLLEMFQTLGKVQTFQLDRSVTQLSLRVATHLGLLGCCYYFHVQHPGNHQETLLASLATFTKGVTACLWEAEINRLAAHDFFCWFCWWPHTIQPGKPNCRGPPEDQPHTPYQEVHSTWTKISKQEVPGSAY